MYGPNIGLEIGKRALLSQQLALNLTGHNIANVNTPGFTRQQAIMTNSQPLRMPFGNVGSGVDISEIRRLRSAFIDEQFRSENQKLGKWNLLNDSWNQIQSIINEPQDTGLGALLDEFWNSWQNLSNNPQSEAARVAVREQAVTLTNSFKHISRQLLDLRNSLDSDIDNMVEQINSSADQIAELNQLITAAELEGGSANDLRDMRDLLVDNLSQWVDVSTIEKPGGSMTVYIGAMALVDGTSTLKLGTTVESNTSSTIHRVFFEGTGVTLLHPGGEFEGLLVGRDNIVVKQIEQLDNLALGMVKAVNGAHASGFGLNESTGINFFDENTTGAQDIDLDFQIYADVNNIAASLNGEVGDNSNALNIAALRDSLVMSDGRSSFNGYYNSMVGQIGVGASEAESMLKNQEAMVAQIENTRLSLSGVSLDEEMANMIKYQHAFEAAARVITTMDMALDTVINGMGITGRA